jgi:hypothetical protein
MMEFSASQLLGGSAAALIIGRILDWWGKQRTEKVDLVQNTKDITEVYRIMKHVTKDSFYDRFMVFKGEDSAGVLVPGKNLYVSCQYEEVAQESVIRPIIDEIQRWRSDQYYYEMFSEMLLKGSVTIRTEDLPQCKLKDIYIAQEIKICKIYHLMTTKNSALVFYCSVASSVVDAPTSEDNFIVDSAIDRLIDIFNRHKKYY